VLFPGPDLHLARSATQDLAEWLCDQGDEALKASSLVELSSRRQVLMEKLEATARAPATAAEKRDEMGNYKGSQTLWSSDFGKYVKYDEICM